MTDRQQGARSGPGSPGAAAQRASLPIVPPATIGMLGGGQLGRYAVWAARRMGYGTIVLDPDPGAPAGRVADEHLVAAFDDVDAVARLGAQCALVTTEFENPPAVTLDQLAAVTNVAPPPSAVAVAQDRIAEKRFLAAAAVAVGPFTVLDAGTGGGPSEVWEGQGDGGFPAVLKTARLGYDGKGQERIETARDVADAWERLGRVPCVLERRLDLTTEVSVVVARSRSGEVAAYECAENHHVDGILDVTVVPARVPSEIAAGAVGVAKQIAEALDYVGVLAVELFVVGGQLLVNEIAPRPHNSGHWTIDAAATDQFAQQIRAVAGLPLAPAQMTTPAAAMVNLLGDIWVDGEPDWASVLADPSVRLHLYGKAAARPGRKMGHLTATGATADEAAERVMTARASLR